jgi:hypothetical protein
MLCTMTWSSVATSAWTMGAMQLRNAVTLDTSGPVTAPGPSLSASSTSSDRQNATGSAASLSGAAAVALAVVLLVVLLVGRLSVASMMLLIVCELDRDDVNMRLPIRGAEALPSSEGVRGMAALGRVSYNPTTHETQRF